MLYLLCDLVLFDGPLKTQARRIQGIPEDQFLADQERGVVARVFAKPILLSQVDYAVDEMLWRRGKSRNDISKRERIELRTTAVHELCDHALLREKVALNGDEFPVSEKEIEAAMLRSASRFTTKQDLVNAMKDFGFEGEKELKFRIAARLQQNKYIEHHIARGIAVTDEEALAWYNDHPEACTVAERIKARHIFLAALENSEEKAINALTEAKNQLAAGAHFSTLAAQLSEDERSKKVGGNLGWMTRSRLPKDFADATFSLPLKTPTLITTKVGYHIIEVTEKAPAQRRSFEEMKPEIVAALEASRRKEAIKTYRNNLHHQHPDKIIIHTEMLNNDWTE